MLNSERSTPKYCENIMKGITPCLSYEPVRQTPRPDLIKTIRDFVSTGLKTQREIAVEVGLSRTKISQFVNNMKRVKGWTEVEKKLDAYVKQFNKLKRTANSRFLNKMYHSSNGKPLRPLENVFRSPKLHIDCGLLREDVDEDELSAFVNVSMTRDTQRHSYTLDELINIKYNDSDDSVKESIKSPVYTFFEDDKWSSFEISKIFP